MRIFITFLCLFLLSMVHASDECPTSDLNARADSPFRKIPIYDQDGTGNCYAYAAAQMIDYYRIQKNDQNYELTNPIYAGWATYFKDRKSSQRKSLTAGKSVNVFKALKNTGICDNKEVARRMNALMKDTGLSEARAMFFLETAYKHSANSSNPHELEQVKKDFNVYATTCNENVTAFIDNLELNGLFAAAPTLVLHNLFHGCPAKPVDVPDVQWVHTGTDSKVRDALEKGLLENQLPVQINYCASPLDTPASEPQPSKPPSKVFSFIKKIIPRAVFTGRTSAGCGDHAALISGQTTINGQCHYQIRNSYGSYWYPPGATSCACITKEGVYKEQCEKGEGQQYVGCWFKREDVLANTKSVNVFK